LSRLTRNHDREAFPRHRFYSDLAEWWPLISPPEEYVEEAAFAASLLRMADPPTRTVLELGSGGGNNAFYLKHEFEMTLVDLSDDMLAVSRELNPECEHLQGDMRTVRLGRTFDAVFLHDAIDYMTMRPTCARRSPRRTSTVGLAVWQCSSLTTSPRISYPRPTTAAMMHQTAAAPAT
jgi:hypothetical protein